MQLANLAGNRAAAAREAGRGRRAASSAPDPGQAAGLANAPATLQVGDPAMARLLDLLMRTLDRAGVARARSRIAGGARGDVLEIGIGSGLNLHVYPPDATVHGIDASPAVLELAAVRARRLGRSPVLGAADASRLPYPDASFDTVVATFVLCSVDDVQATLREARRVLRPGGTVRLLEHARSHHQRLAGAQRRLAPAWARASGGCRLDHDVREAVRRAGLHVVDERRRGAGVLVELVAVA
jgi:SAM-dependent methyltransferase